MKKLYLILIATTLIISCENNKKAETVTVKHESSIINPEVSFGVRGNCGMLDIKTKSSLDSIAIKIHQAVADSGYDTELMTSTEESYNSLPGCCQYNREMVITNNN